MRRIFSLIVLVVFCLVSVSCHKANSKKRIDQKTKLPILTVYCTDDILSLGFGRKLFAPFEKANKCEIQVVNCDDGGNMVERLKREKKKPLADVILGLHQGFMEEVLNEELLQPYQAKRLQLFDKNYLFDPSYHLIPYAYGHLGIIYNDLLISHPPQTFGELQDPIYRNLLLVPDPRTSSIGRGALVWSVAAFGQEGFRHFWNSIQKNIKTMPVSWADGYARFKKGDAPMIIGYTTFPAWCIQYENTEHIKCVVPQEGSYTLYSAAGIVRDTPQEELAEKFVDYLLSPQIQGIIPYTLSIYPLDKSIYTPNSFALMPINIHPLNDNLQMEELQNKTLEWLNRWTKIIAVY